MNICTELKITHSASDTRAIQCDPSLKEPWLLTAGIKARGVVVFLSQVCHLSYVHIPNSILFLVFFMHVGFFYVQLCVMTALSYPVCVTDHRDTTGGRVEEERFKEKTKMISSSPEASFVFFQEAVNLFSAPSSVFSTVLPSNESHQTSRESHSCLCNYNQCTSVSE